METWELLDDEVTVRKEGHMVWFRVDCKPPCEPTRLLRCYGAGTPNDLLVGVLEPKDGRLILERKISRDALRQAETGGIPKRFYLSDGGARERVSEPLPSDTRLPEAAPATQEEPSAPAVPEIPCENANETTASADLEKAPAQPPEALPGAPRPAVSGPLPLTALDTGDDLLNAVLASGEAHCEWLSGCLRITCPFSPVQPFALAFIAPLCRIEQNTAVLDWVFGKPDPCPD